MQRMLGTVHTISPFFNPIDKHAMCNALEPLFVATAWWLLQFSRYFFQIFELLALSQKFDFKECATDFTSDLSINCLLNGIISFLLRF